MLRGAIAATLVITATAWTQDEPPITEAEQITLLGDQPVEIPPVLSLAMAEEIALRENPSLLAAETRIFQALARVKQARAEYFPQLGASLSAQVTEIPERDERAAFRAVRQAQIQRLPQTLFGFNIADTDAITRTVQSITSAVLGLRQGKAAIDDTNESFRASIDATWLLFDGFGRKFRNAAARFDARQNEALYHESQRILLSAVAAAYYNVQLARENIAIAQADRGFNERQLSDAEARRRVGTGSLGDVLNFEIRVKEAQSALIAANRNFNVALIALAELMGMPQIDDIPAFEVDPLHTERPEEMRLPEAPPLVNYALDHRPDMLQSQFAVERAEAVVGARRSTYYPRLDAFASRDAIRTENPRFREEDFSSTIGIVLNYDIYAGGRRKGLVGEARAAQREAELLNSSVALTIAADVRTALENLNTAQQELVLQRTTTELVQRNLALVERGYAEGTESLVRLNEAQRDLVAQQSRLALALVALRLSWHELRTATAQTLEPHMTHPAE